MKSTVLQKVWLVFAAIELGLPFLLTIRIN